MPATVDATCVPWPNLSPVPSEPEKSFSSTTWAARSGWEVSTPVSRTATFTPVPSYPAAHAAGAPICGTLRSSEALRRPSSQTFSTAPDSPAVTVSQKSAVRFLAERIDLPLTTGSARPIRAPASVNGLIEGVFLPLNVTISGTSDRPASS